MFAIAWYGFLMLLGLVILPFIVKNRGSALQRLLRIAAGFVVWVLLVFSDVLLQKIFTLFVCSLPGFGTIEEASVQNPLPVFHIGALDGQDCDRKCQKGLYEYGIGAVTAFKITDDNRELVRFWLEPCDSDSRGACIQVDIENRENPSWEILETEPFNLFQKIEWSPMRVYALQKQWASTSTGQVFASRTSWGINLSLFKYPLNYVYNTWSTCRATTNYTYPELRTEQ